MSSDKELGELADELQASGADDFRVHVVRCARSFKRTWVEMAAVLVKVRKQHAFTAWGYNDFYDYCAGELKITRPTADKLTGSYVALQRYAPAVLKRDGIAERIPTADAVDYFARALGTDAANDGKKHPDYPDEVVAELRNAVFDDGAPVSELRKRFNPVFHPKSDERVALEILRKANSSAVKLASQITEVQGLSQQRVDQVHAALKQLQHDLSLLTDEARKLVGRKKAS